MFNLFPNFSILLLIKKKNAMGKAIDKNSAPHYFWGDNCSSWILANRESLSVKFETMPGKTKETPHYHSSSWQFFYMLKGSAVFYIDGELELVGEQQGILIEPMSKHFIINESADPIDFLLISQPNNATYNDRTDVE